MAEAFLETEVSFMIAEESCCSGEAHAFEQWKLPSNLPTTGIEPASRRTLNAVSNKAIT